MSKPFASSSSFGGFRGISFVFFMVLWLICWFNVPYTILTCNNGSCSLTRDKEFLASFETSEIKDCKVVVKTERRRRSGSHGYRNVTLYYPEIILEDGSKIQDRAFDYSTRNGVDDFCYALMSNPNFKHKAK
ncbi:hypothetical protein J6A64_05850 [bacterium]|nr:hypothetical protein [bacterium]